MGLFDQLVKSAVGTMLQKGQQLSQPYQPRPQQQPSQQRQPGAMGNLIASLVQGQAGRTAQASQLGQAEQAQAPQAWAPQPMTAASYMTTASPSGQRREEAKKDETDEKAPGTDKKRNKSWWHTNLDKSLGTEGVGGFVNDVLSYSAPVAIADTFSPEWAQNPLSQKEAAEQTYGGNGPMEFSGEYGMPSADQLQQLTPEQQQEWWNDTFQGLNSSAAAAMAAGGQIANVGRAGAKALAPTLGRTAKAADNVLPDGTMIVGDASKVLPPTPAVKVMPDGTIAMDVHADAFANAARNVAGPQAAKAGQRAMPNVPKAAAKNADEAAEGAVQQEAKQAGKEANAANEEAFAPGEEEYLAARFGTEPVGGEASSAAGKAASAAEPTPTASQAAASQPAQQAARQLTDEEMYMLNRFGVEPSRFEQAVANNVGNTAQSAAKGAGQTAAKEAAGKTAGTVENAVNNVYGDNLGWALRHGKVGKAEGKGGEKALTEYEQYVKSQAEEAKKLDELMPGTKEYEEQLKKVYDISQKKMNLYEDELEFGGNSYSQFLKEAEGNLSAGGMAKGRGQKQAEILDLGKEKKLRGDIDKILRKPSSGNVYEGTTDAELVEFLGDRSLEQLGKLDPRVQDIVLDTYRDAIREGASPTRAQFNQMIGAAKNAQATGQFRSGQANKKAAGVLGALAAVLGGANALESQKETYVPFIPGMGEQQQNVGNSALWDSDVDTAESGTAETPGIGDVGGAGGQAASSTADAMVQQAKNIIAQSNGIADPSSIPDSVAVEAAQQYFGLSEEDWYKLEQRDQYNQAMQQEAMRNWLGSLDEAYLDPKWGYENFRNGDLGHKEEMIRNFLGYGDKALELPEWREMYNNAIVKWTEGKEHLTGDEEHDIPLVMDYMFGTGALDPNMALYIGDEGQKYRAGHTIGYGDASSENMSQYLLNNDTDLAQLADANGNRILPEGIDNSDVALLLWLEDMENRKDQGIYGKYGQDNLDQISALLSTAGDTNTAFEFYEPAKGESEFQWNPREGLNYSSFMNALSANPAALEQFYPIYNQEGVEGAVGADFADTLMSELQKRSGKKIRRKNKE